MAGRWLIFITIITLNLGKNAVVDRVSRSIVGCDISFLCLESVFVRGEYNNAKNCPRGTIHLFFAVVQCLIGWQATSLPLAVDLHTYAKMMLIVEVAFCYDNILWSTICALLA